MEAMCRKVLNRRKRRHRKLANYQAFSARRMLGAIREQECEEKHTLLGEEKTITLLEGHTMPGENVSKALLSSSSSRKYNQMGKYQKEQLSININFVRMSLIGSLVFITKTHPPLLIENTTRGAPYLEYLSSGENLAGCADLVIAPDEVTFFKV